MSVLIKGMEMPTNCNDCIFDTWGLCLINSNLEAKDELTHSCPLVPVPEHGDLIDRDALPTSRVEWEDIVNAPAIIPADKEDGTV